MRANNNVTEITGSPAKVWGNVQILCERDS